MKYELLGKLSLKCVLVGDSECGKTVLASRITSKEFRAEYVPTMFDNYAATIFVDNVPYHLSLFDTSGRDDVSSSKLRVLSYSKCDLFLVCFSVQNEQSLEHIEERWIPEIRMHQPTTPFILVGTQIDKRFETPDIQVKSNIKVSPALASDVAVRTNAESYIEVSALSEDGVYELVKEIVVTVNRSPVDKKQKSTCKCCKLL
ncbi:cell division control protein 42 homolog [Mytilus californianus]|uniref:cell division control protein 42 homolog n=1 Tax=Mytilus californianus TaxID=6549 RepID=UPI0022450577|nr:cell division control protein 42 homolog [Mytilus californianus]